MKIVKVQPSAYTDSIEGGAKLPYPFFVDEQGFIGSQSMWNGNPLMVIGFQKRLDVSTIDLLCEEFLAAPELAVGMWLVTSNGNGKWGTHLTAIQSVEVFEGEPLR